MHRLWLRTRAGAFRLLWPCAALAAALACLGLPPSAAASGATKLVSYRGYRVRVPASWPVFDLSRQPGVCVRFNRHAVYLGPPNATAPCPAHAAGRTEALLIEPVSDLASAARVMPIPALSQADAAAGSSARLVDRARGVVVYASWGAHPQIIARALGVPSLSALARASRVRPAPARSVRSARAFTIRREGTGPPATPGQVLTGLGFDACSTPSSTAMAAWGASPYQAVGVYIGGANMACSQANLTASWVSAEASAGWHLIPIYVGLQAPSNSCGCAGISPASATTEGTAAALDAIAQAQSLGLGTGNPIYFDMEAYARTTTNTDAVTTFLAAWTTQLHASGYLSGVYAGDNSGVVDLVALVGTGYPEPDELWIANWNDEQTTADPNVPATDWPNHQRLHQYEGGHDERYDDVTINIDGDDLDAATAAPGSTPPPPPPAPSLSVAPASDGSIVLRPSWNGGPAVSSWQLLGGASPTSLAIAADPVSASSIVIHSAYPYFEVNALSAVNQVLGTSAPVATPPHVVLIGNNAFVPRAGIGAVPVACFNTGPCHIAATMTEGRRTLVRTAAEYVPSDGGLLYFSLSKAVHRLIARASRGVPVEVALKDTSGLTTTRPMVLTPFTTSGPTPARTPLQSPSIRVLGLTVFVSNAWVGGVLAGCFADAPCHVQTFVTIGHTTIARTGSEFLGANELGYLVFTLTPAGHEALLQAKGNQLLARVTSISGAERATSRVVLVAYR